MQYVDTAILAVKRAERNEIVGSWFLDRPLVWRPLEDSLT